MNSIKLDSTFETCFTIERQEYRHIRTTLIIDKSPLHENLSINLKELVKSTLEDGEYFIFTWYEDYPDSDGNYYPDEGFIDFPVRVSHEGQITRWRLVSPIDVSIYEIEEYCREKELDYEDYLEELYRDEFKFNKDAYIDAVRNGLNEIKSMIKGYPSFVHFGVHRFNEWDLMGLDL